MVSTGRRRGTTRFSIEAGDTAREVALAGDFTHWQPKRMRRQRNGAFVLIVALPPGEYEYKFIVDGQWLTDPENPRYAISPCGTSNSVLRVECLDRTSDQRSRQAPQRAAEPSFAG
ncbi:hypothetical protein LCGC14_1929260 [marine sediment metagenome]|uniref:AMP-activated protein kinase glycogen-binding domain-containing protein n=1 Tax=marine sediment metagenome TaxID=412755 RepID=A0A0F9FP37_9ZZZZ